VVQTRGPLRAGRYLRWVIPTFGLALLPWSAELDALAPPFRARLETVLAALRADGWDPVVTSTWRSDEVQGVLHQLPATTRATAGRSCHNGSIDGQPAARAADVWQGGLALGVVAGVPSALEAQVPFLRALGAEARRAGLRWGGDWHGRDSVWDTWQLGWDPAHVELGPCGG